MCCLSGRKFVFTDIPLISRRGARQVAWRCPIGRHGWAPALGGQVRLKMMELQDIWVAGTHVGHRRRLMRRGPCAPRALARSCDRALPSALAHVLSLGVDGDGGFNCREAKSLPGLGGDGGWTLFPASDSLTRAVPSPRARTKSQNFRALQDPERSGGAQAQPALPE